MGSRLIFLHTDVRLKQRDGFLSSAGRLEMSGPIGPSRRRESQEKPLWTIIGSVPKLTQVGVAKSLRRSRERL